MGKQAKTCMPIISGISKYEFFPGERDALLRAAGKAIIEQSFTLDELLEIIQLCGEMKDRGRSAKAVLEEVMKRTEPCGQ